MDYRARKRERKEGRAFWVGDRDIHELSEAGSALDLG